MGDSRLEFLDCCLHPGDSEAIRPLLERHQRNAKGRASAGGADGR